MTKEAQGIFDLDEPRELTEDEVREQYLGLIQTYVRYWHNLPNKTCRERMEGLAFSMLVILDGESGLPGFIVAPCPHQDDKEYHKDQGDNWFPENHKSNVKCDIAGEAAWAVCRKVQVEIGEPR